jgi:hypothetical protein
MNVSKQCRPPKSAVAIYISSPNSLVQGEAGANVLVGIQVAPKDFDEFESRADSLGYEYMSEHNNEIYRLLLRDPNI